MNRKIIRLARAGKCVGLTASGDDMLPALGEAAVNWSSMAVNASEPKPQLVA